MKKRNFIKILYPFVVVFLLLFLTTSSLLCLGSSCNDNTIPSMALAFDKYLKESAQDYVAAEFSSDDVKEPFRQSDFNRVSIYQNLWQLSKGPDNSLIRVNKSAYLPAKDAVVSPLTLYPKYTKKSEDFSSELTPVFYTGYDQDFRGDYLDIKIVQLQDKEKQINWSDFYTGGKMANYKKDTHSIMISEQLARRFYASMKDIDINDVTSENIESLVGIDVRSKVIYEGGTKEAPEREKDLPKEERDPTILESDFYSEEACRFKRIIGILDNKSAEKYLPIFGSEEFAFVVTSFATYDCFHPTVYGMFKNNLVGNRTSLRYFMDFGKYAQNHSDYHLNFCDVVDGQLERNGTLQKNYENCLSFYNSDAHLIASSIFAIVAVVSLSGLIAFVLILLFRRKEEIIKNKIFYLLFIALSELISLFVFYLLKRFLFFGFYLPTMSILGFVFLLSIDVGVLILFLILTKRREHVSEKKAIIKYTENLSFQFKNKKTLLFSVLKESLFTALLGFVTFVVVCIVLARSAITSMGIPFFLFFLGIEISLFVKKFNCAYKIEKITKTIVENELISDVLSLIGIIVGVLFGATLGFLGMIWVNNIGFSLVKIIIAIILSLVVYSSNFWFIRLLAKYNKWRNKDDSKNKGGGYDSISI